MKPGTKKALIWGSAIVGTGLLAWGIYALVKKSNGSGGSGSGGSGSGGTGDKKPTYGKPLYSKNERKLVQHVVGGEEPCYVSTFPAGTYLGEYLGTSDGSYVRNALTSGCSQENRAALNYGISDEKSTLYAKVSRPGGQILFLRYSSDLYTK